MSKVKDENYIVIQGWMVNQLNLKGNELLIYALIYGFSQDGEQKFTGSLQYIADWTNSTKAGVSKALKKLVEKGLIVKNDNIVNGVKFCEYHVTKLDRVCNKVVRDIQQSCIGGMQQSSPNNIDIYNIEKNLDNNIDIQPAKEVRHKYGFYNNVLLSDKDLEKLKNEFPTDYKERIERLSEYVASTGKKYKNHLATIRAWARKDKIEQPKKDGYGTSFMDLDF